ncbi:PREDICTED: sterile alpha motif domain-containing protein 9-like [Branchiostoma belcheri]|uniref:Sterile alpha motif domain-containing protein 9-like n=1 Tax=Branchiostoma belcheri TaxID=7741 RepID=A0A6P4YJZ0_BRABE|nr:PREDICTED: sterile alpha motif domain-containing protein 9-like [Branchiostoma belcheri]
MKAFVLKTNVMTAEAESNLVLPEKGELSDKESLSVPPQSPIETVTTEKAPTKSKVAVEDPCSTNSKLLGPGKTAQQDSVTSISTNAPVDEDGKDVGANKLSLKDQEQASPINDIGRSDLGTLQKSHPSAQPQLPAPSKIPSGHSSAMPSTSSTYESQRPFPFGKNDIGKFSYKSGYVLTVMESGAGSLLSPCHEFKVYQWVESTDQKLSSEAKEYFIFETLRFVTGCINARRNGTIHFGIGDDDDGKYQHGEIVGTWLQEHLKTEFDDMIKKSIDIYFNHDWAKSAVNQCIYPVRFIPVDLEESEPSVRKYVIEVDVAPTFSLTENRAFFIEFRKMKMKTHKMRQEERLYFRERASTVHYTGSKLDDFQHNLLRKLVQERKELDQKNNSTIERPSYNNEDNAKKLKSCLLGGETDLKAKYPILFVSKTDSQTRGIESELGFIAEIPWIAIFDLDPSSDHSGICNLFRSQMKRECLLYRPEEKFLHFSDHEELAEAILFPEKTCWIFANGRHALGVDPCDDKKWTGTERCKAVKNAISFFSSPDKIPPGKAVVVFLILSEDIDIMVSCFRNCFVDFCGVDNFYYNFLCLFENKNAYESWENQVGSVCGPGELQRKSIVGMPWAHINQTVQSINGHTVQTEPHIPTSSGSYVSLTNQQRNKLDDLEVLSKNQCEDQGLDPESEGFEEFCQEKEMLFYKGNEVDWLNFFLTDVYSKNHVMKREKFRELHRLISVSLFQRDPHLKGKSVIITLYYQAGSGATTLGRHILWEFRESNVRCCVIKRITEGTANQILTLRRYLEKDENECLPVLVLIDNKNEELVQNLIAGIERQIKEKGVVTEKPVCIILQCKRTPDAKKLHDDNPSKSEYLEQSVSDNEMIWLEKKQEELEKKQENLSSDYGSDTEYAEDADEPMTQSENSLIRTPLNLDKNPDRFIKFMILRKNFDPEFVRNFVANSLTEIKGNEQLLLRYTALLNVFVEKEDSFVPLHCAEALMGINENKYRTMDNTLSRAVKVFLIVVERYTCGIVEGYKIVDPLLASEVLKHIVAENETYSSIACDFLESRLFCNTYTTKELIFFTKEMLKRRKKFAYGDETETHFSLLVERICYEEGHENAAAVLQKGLKLDKFVDAIIAQTLARLFLRHDDFAQAHEYAGIAVDQDSNNSYLLVTAGKVYHEEMIQKFDMADSGLTLSMLQDALSLAMSAVEQYHKSKEANRTGRYPPNMHCYLEEIKICFKLLFNIRRVDPFKGRDGQANLQRYLTDPKFVPDEVQGVWKEYHEWIKSLKGRIDASIERLDKDFRYNKPKSRDKEHDRFKKKFYEMVRNYNQFFGMLENSVIGSDEERKRLQACTVLEGYKVNFSVAFEYIKGKGRNAVPNLTRALDQLIRIPEREAFDLEGLISVSLALSTADPHSKKIPSFKQVYEWCVELCTLAPTTLEPHLFRTMFLWPREDMDIDFDAGSFKNSKDRLSNLHKEQCPSHVLRHFQAHKRMTITGYSRAMPATNFFLSTGKGLQSFVHISSLLTVNTESQRNFDRDQFWERTEVQEKLRRLEGICLNHNTISYQVKDFPRIEIHSSRPIAIKGASQDRVSFFLGFSWEGPIAYNVKVQEDW